jgi:cell division protein FtsZ
VIRAIDVQVEQVSAAPLEDMIAAAPTSFTIHDVTPPELDIEVVDAEVVKPVVEEETAIDNPLSTHTPTKTEAPAVLFQLEEDSQPNTAQDQVQSHQEGEIKRFVLEMEEEEPPKPIAQTTKAATEAPVVKKKPFSPLDGTIEEGLSRRTEERKQQLKQFNYRFSNNKRVDDLEREPAYKRQDVSLDTPSHDETNSRTTLSTDSQDGLQFRTNNSFLHDNVD